MKTILLILFVFLVFQTLKRMAGEQNRRQVPGYRILDDDAPLPGPWNRRSEPVEKSPAPQTGARRAEPGGDSPLPGPWNRLPEDLPLPGPWDRKQKRQEPVQTGPYAEPGYEEPGYEEAGYGAGGEPTGTGRQPLPGAPPRKAPEPPPVKPEREPGKRFRKEDRTPFRQEKIAAGEPVCPPDERPAAAQPSGRKRRAGRRQNPLEAVLASHTTLVGSIVLGEVLGRRGGRMANRR